MQEAETTLQHQKEKNHRECNAWRQQKLAQTTV
jgi:hypothetical protein